MKDNSHKNFMTTQQHEEISAYESSYNPMDNSASSFVVGTSSIDTNKMKNTLDQITGNIDPEKKKKLEASLSNPNMNFGELDTIISEILRVDSMKDDTMREVFYSSREIERRKKYYSIRNYIYTIGILRNIVDLYTSSVLQSDSGGKHLLQFQTVLNQKSNVETFIDYILEEVTKNVYQRYDIDKVLQNVIEDVLELGDGFVFIDSVSAYMHQFNNKDDMIDGINKNQLSLTEQLLSNGSRSATASLEPETNLSESFHNAFLLKSKPVSENKMNFVTQKNKQMITETLELTETANVFTVENDQITKTIFSDIIEEGKIFSTEDFVKENTSFDFDNHIHYEDVDDTLDQLFGGLAESYTNPTDEKKKEVIKNIDKYYSKINLDKGSIVEKIDPLRIARLTYNNRLLGYVYIKYLDESVDEVSNIFNQHSMNSGRFTNSGAAGSGLNGANGSSQTTDNDSTKTNDSIVDYKKFNSSKDPTNKMEASKRIQLMQAKCILHGIVSPDQLNVVDDESLLDIYGLLNLERKNKIFFLHPNQIIHFKYKDYENGYGQGLFDNVLSQLARYQAIDMLEWVFTARKFPRTKYTINLSKLNQGGAELQQHIRNKLKISVPDFNGINGTSDVMKQFSDSVNFIDFTYNDTNIVTTENVSENIPDINPEMKEKIIKSILRSLRLPPSLYDELDREGFASQFKQENDHFINISNSIQKPLNVSINRMMKIIFLNEFNPSSIKKNKKDLLTYMKDELFTEAVESIWGSEPNDATQSPEGSDQDDSWGQPNDQDQQSSDVAEQGDDGDIWDQSSDNEEPNDDQGESQAQDDSWGQPNDQDDTDNQGSEWSENDGDNQPPSDDNDQDDQSSDNQWGDDSDGDIQPPSDGDNQPEGGDDFGQTNDQDKSNDSWAASSDDGSDKPSETPPSDEGSDSEWGDDSDGDNQPPSDGDNQPEGGDDWGQPNDQDQQSPDGDGSWAGGDDDQDRPDDHSNDFGNDKGSDWTGDDGDNQPPSDDGRPDEHSDDFTQDPNAVTEPVKVNWTEIDKLIPPEEKKLSVVNMDENTKISLIMNAIRSGSFTLRPLLEKQLSDIDKYSANIKKAADDIASVYFDGRAELRPEDIEELVRNPQKRHDIYKDLLPTVLAKHFGFHNVIEMNLIQQELDTYFFNLVKDARRKSILDGEKKEDDEADQDDRYENNYGY